MAKILLAISPHSFVDVITNSSTELFVCDTTKTVDMIEEILKANLKMHGYDKPWVFDLKKYREWKKKEREKQEYFEKHGNWRKGKRDYKNKFSYIDGWFFDLEDEEDLKNIRKEYIEYGDGSGVWYTSSRNPFHDRIFNATRAAEKKYPGDWSKSYTARENEIEKIYQEIESQTNKPDWWINPFEYNHNKTSLNELDKKIIILSTDDNSIPYEQFDWIENMFNAKKYHLG